MKRNDIIALMLAALVFVVGVAVFPVMEAQAADTTLMDLESAQTVTGTKTFSAQGPITFDGGPTIDGTASSNVVVTYTASGAVLGSVEYAGGSASPAAGDDFIVTYTQDADTGTNAIICKIVVDFTDETGGTEDSTYAISVMVNGTLTTIATVSGTALTVVGDVAGTTIGGITQANLVDKTATEAITGTYTFPTSTVMGAVAFAHSTPVFTLTVRLAIQT